MIVFPNNFPSFQCPIINVKSIEKNIPTPSGSLSFTYPWYLPLRKSISVDIHFIKIIIEITINLQRNYYRSNNKKERNIKVGNDRFLLVNIYGELLIISDGLLAFEEIFQQLVGFGIFEVDCKVHVLNLLFCYN